MDVITSQANPLWKKVKRLAKKQGRKKENKFLLEGGRLVSEAVRCAWPLELVCITPDFSEAMKQYILPLLYSRQTKILKVSQTLFSEVAETDSPQGILAIALQPQWHMEDLLAKRGEYPLGIVVVDGVQDPGNLGTIIRSADALGAQGVLLSKGTVDPYNPKTLRATMGSIFRLPVLADLEQKDIINFLSKQAIQLIVGMPREGIPLYQVDLTGPLALLLGSEAQGPSAAFLADEHKTLAVIPMPGGTESLNVGIACSIMLYEMSRQRNLKTLDESSPKEVEL